MCVRVCVWVGVCVGVVRSLHALGRLKRVYCTETRPFNQGSRLTAYEAVAEGIPATLITDSMAALTMREMNITGVFARARFRLSPFPSLRSLFPP